jgi:diguanylate cyclase (GGDEF)-like protein
MTAAPAPPLATALAESRARWREMALLGADLLFETDAAGRLAFLAPDTPLGHKAAALLGTRAADLLAEADSPDPFDPAAPPRGLRAWLATGSGGMACLEFTALPHQGGLRGVARDVTAEERRAEAAGRILRRATALVRLLGATQRARAEGAAAGGALRTLLEGIGPALGSQGAALLAAGVAGWRVIEAAGAPGPLPPGAADGPARVVGGLAVAPAAPGLALAAWRDPAPDAEDLGVLAALATTAAALHQEANRQAELDRAARTDPLTGLLNRRGFAEALAASRMAEPRGILAYLDMDGLKRVNDAHGHAAGDAAIRALAARLTAEARPGELAARLGGDEFALWLPGADLAAARLRCGLLGRPGPLPGVPEAGPEAVAASLGFAEAGPGSTAEALIAAADIEMYARKRRRRAA